MTEYSNYRFSVTIETDDLAIVGCLRVLAKFSQKTGNNQIPWGGTKDRDWRRYNHQITFRFSIPQYRDGFVAEARRLLPESLWTAVDQSDADPATPQGR
jgi:hypothetical protein